MRFKYPLALIFFSTQILYAQAPAIANGGIYNTASYEPAGLPGAAIAQGSLFVVFGSGLGPSTLAQAPALPLGTSLNGTSLSVTVNGISTAPYMFYTSANQIGAIMPSNTPVGTGTITVLYNSRISVAQPIQIAPSSVGIFTVNQAGSGPGIITNSKYAVNSQTSVAAPGDVNIIWATGMGPAGTSGSEAAGTSGSEAAGTATLAALPSTFKVYVGGVSATIAGAARSSSPGLDQIAFTVPPNVSGCSVPVVVQTGSIVSNFVSMAIGSNGKCVDPTTTSPTTPTPTSGTFSEGVISLDHTSTSAFTTSGVTLPASSIDVAGAGFARYTYLPSTTTSPVNPTPTIGVTVNTFGACSVYFETFSTSTTPPTTTPTAPSTVTIVPLDAGPSLVITGPNGVKTLTKQSPGNYLASSLNTSSNFLTGGNYTITSAGGADVGPINTNFTLPPTLTWTNASSVSNVSRANGQLITWTGGDPASTIEILGSSGIIAGATTTIGFFSCLARASDQQFTIPSVVLLALPATPAQTAGITSFNFIGMGATSALQSFAAAGLGIGYLEASTSFSQFVTFQ